jgi:hypothetical protein
MIKERNMDDFNLETYRDLPDSKIMKGHSLSQFGISEIAWEATEAIGVIRILVDKGLLILGGDVYSYIDNTIGATYDSWYTNKNDNTNLIENAGKTAEKYITEYIKRNGSNFLFSITYEESKY